jgi:hypothetical protein
MLIAVSILSPVATQTLIPAYLRVAIVEPTSSYNLSSIAVAPTIFIFFSIASYAAATNSSLFSIEV